MDGLHGSVGDDAATLDARGLDDAGIAAYLGECREWVLAEIAAIVPGDTDDRRGLYALMLDYPLREAKALRPALCVAACRALGGERTAILRSAAVIELYHNAFLIHDDVEDASLMRRGGPTLHHAHGVPIAINVGDAMFALSLRPLLDNTATLGLGKALRILQAVARMVQESVEGQALELDWIRQGTWALGDDDYVDMVIKKTGWYSFITPIQIGCIGADAPPAVTARLEEFARCLGVAFQIQDDLLNLEQDTGGYGKELCGDLWEGKRTLILLHALRCASPEDRAEAVRILGKPRPTSTLELPALLHAMTLHGDLTIAGEQELLAHLAGAGPTPKTEPEVAWLAALIERHASRAHAREIATRWVAAAERALAACTTDLAPSTHHAFLRGLTRYVLDRLH